MQTDAMWDDNRTLVGSKFQNGHWRVGLISAADGSFAAIPNTEDCTAVHRRPSYDVAA